MGDETKRKRLEKALADLTKRSEKLSAARASLPPGSSRARVTAANAKWARVAEARDLAQRALYAFDAADPESSAYAANASIVGFMARGS